MVKEVYKEHKNLEMTRKKIRRGSVYFDYSLLAILICLVCFGLVMLYCTSSYSAMMKLNGDSLFYFKRQLLFCIVGFIGMWLVSKIGYLWYINKSMLFFFFSIFFLSGPSPMIFNFESEYFWSNSLKISIKSR